MRIYHLTRLMVFAMLCAGIPLSFISCSGPGMMSTSVGTNISDQPVWGPTGYDHADYHYIPDINSYYSVSERQYIYQDGSNWTHAATLPPGYSNYDPYHSYKVVVNEAKPYQNNDNHQAKYRSFKSVKDQPVIRDSHDPRYFVNKDHPEHDAWVKEHQH